MPTKEEILKLRKEASMPMVWLSDKSDSVLGSLIFQGSDFPWVYGKFDEFDAFSKYKPKFERLAAIRELSDELLYDLVDEDKSTIDALENESDAIETEIDSWELKVIRKDEPNKPSMIITINISNGEFEYK